MVVILKKGSAVRSSRDSVAFDFRGRIELRRRSRGRIIDSTANLKQHNTAIGLCAVKCSGGFIKVGNMKISGHMLLQSNIGKDQQCSSRHFLCRPSRLWRSGRAYVEYIADDMYDADSLWTSTDSLRTSTNSPPLSTDTLQTSTDSLMTSTDSLPTFTDFY